MKLQFTPNARIALFVLLALPLLLGLGVWQIQRGFDKRAVEDDYRQHQAKAPLEVNGDALEALPVYRRVIARGEFDPQRHWLLDNKHRHGRVGYEVVTPFRLENGPWLLVNRGWLPAGESRQQLPEIPAVPGTVSIFAQVAPVTDHPLLSARHDGGGWPRVVTELDVDDMSEQLGLPLADRVLRLDDVSPGALHTGWRLTPMDAHRHWGYALQWFGLALALLVWALVTNTNLAAWWRHRRQSRSKRSS